MVNIPRRKQIIRHIRADILIAHTPHRARRHRRDLRDEFLAEVAGAVGVAFHVVLPAVPLPGGRPGDGGAGRGVESRALRAGGRAAFAPEVVLHAVAGLGVAFLLAAHVFGVGGGEGGESEEEERAAAGEGGGEHVGELGSVEYGWTEIRTNERTRLSVMGRGFSEGNTYTLPYPRDRPPWKMPMSTPTIPSQPMPRH